MGIYEKNLRKYQSQVDDYRLNHVAPDTFEITECNNRLVIKFEYLEEAVGLIKMLPGAKWDWFTHSWTISTRYRKRFDDTARQIEALVKEAFIEHKAQSARDEAARVAVNKTLAQDAKDNPIHEPAGWRITMVEGRWIVASPYDPAIVTKFKHIRAAKWTGQVWTFPAGAREALTAIVTETMAAATDA